MALIAELELRCISLYLADPTATLALAIKWLRVHTTIVALEVPRSLSAALEGLFAHLQARLEFSALLGAMSVITPPT